MELLKLQTDLQSKGTPYVLATVVEVIGSASAKAGSKAVLCEGKNLWGWVGGGCAESYAISQAEEAILERQPRIIIADLDDEVFGLGMPCGGKMKIFLDPILPADKLTLPYSKNMESLVQYFGFQIENLDHSKNLENFGSSEIHNTSSQKSTQDPSNQECLIEIAIQIAKYRGLKNVAEDLHTFFHSEFAKNLPGKKITDQSNHVLILGHSRITEELAKLFHLIHWKVEVYGLELNPENYPSAVSARKAQRDYEGLEFYEGSFVVVASHHKGDHEFIERALRQKARFVGMVASHKRANLVLEALNHKGVKNLDQVQSPVGVPLQCRNPKEIALSIVIECLKRSLESEKQFS